MQIGDGLKQMTSSRSAMMTSSRRPQADGRWPQADDLNQMSDGLNQEEKDDLRVINNYCSFHCKRMRPDYFLSFVGGGQGVGLEVGVAVGLGGGVRASGYMGEGEVSVGLEGGS